MSEGWFLECWHVLSIREDEAEPPFIWLGFKPGITQERFEAVYRNGRLEDVEALCYRLTVHAGETYFIPGGMPHALGEGCFVVEIQEPTDLTAVPISQKALIDFRKSANPLGEFQAIDDELYDRRTLGSFDYTGRSLNEVLALTKSKNPIIRSGAWGEERLIIGSSQTAYFSCTELTIHGSVPLVPTGEIRIGIVTTGSGCLKTGNTCLHCRRGTELFLPIGATDVTAEGDMTVIFAHPSGAVIAGNAQETEG